MSSYTSNYFNNLNSNNTYTSSNKSTKKKKEEDDELTTSFTKSYFKDYDFPNYSENTSDTEYTKEFVNKYNTFIDELNSRKKARYDEQLAKTESAALYYVENKDNLVKERNKNLIYNWNLNASGGAYFDYGAVPVQDKKGYLKQTDSNGNIYWVDIKNDLLYDANYNLINDNRLKDEAFMNDLKYEYNEQNKLDSKYLSTQDKLSLNKIDESKYMTIVNNERYDTKTIDYDKNPVPQSIKDTLNGGYTNTHVKEGWIIEDGKYYKPVSNNLMDYKPDGSQIKIKDNKVYQLVENETPEQMFEGKKTFYVPKENQTYFYSNGLTAAQLQPISQEEVSAKVYEDNFKKFNKALEEGKLTTANNALQTINRKYFGHEISDGYIDMLDGNTKKNLIWFEDRFNSNVEKLNVINNSIANTSDANLLEELNKEKDKLELENTLIQYNRILANQSAMNKVDKIDAMYKPVYEAWDKVGDLWSNTFEEWDDGYDFGDIFGTLKNVFNNSVQSLGVVGMQTNTGIQALINMGLSDMDDSTFKDKWAPAIIDIATYLIPYVGQARIIINYAEPVSVVEAGILREGSATIDSADGSARIPDAKNVIGAGLNIAMNYFSDLVFKSIRGTMSGKVGNKAMLEMERQWYSNTARRILTNMGIHGSSEAVEEFVQTYAEYMQNMEGDLDGNFLRDHLDEALDAALIAFVTASGASGISSSINTIRLGTQAGWYNAQGEYIGPGAEKIGKNLKYKTVDDYFKAVNNGTENIFDSTYYKGAENIRINTETGDLKINSDLSDTNKTVYTATDIKEYEKINQESNELSDVKVDTDTNTVLDIATQLENNQIVSILDSNAITKGTQIDLNTSSGSVDLSNIVVDSNIKTVLVGSKELETYLKSLRPDLTTYVFDPKSNTFMDDIRAYVADVAKSNIVTKNITDFTVNDYKLSPTEMNDINTMVNEAINRGNFKDSINNPEQIKLSPITTSDITDSDINTIMNSIRTKFLNEIDNNKISKETAQKEFKTLNEKISDYVLKTKEDRTYLKDKRNNIIVFSKKGDNIYEAVNTMPSGTADLQVLANVKTNGNIINGNLSTKVDFAKKQLNAVNTLIDKLKLKGNYLTPDSTYKDVASLVKSNREFSKEILQSLNSDGLIEGKNKVRLYTAFDNLDNANANGTVKATSNYLKSENFNKELSKKVETTAPRTVDLKPQESKVSVEEKPISVEEYASNPENPSELNNIELEKMLDDSFKDLQIKNKLTKDNALELKNIVKNAVFDGYSHIVDIANVNEDYNVKNAVYDMQAVASDAQTMINGAQMKNGEVIGKPLKRIYPDNNIKTKKDKELFEKVMLHALNAERERAGVDKIFENVSAKQSEAIVKKAFEQHPNFEEAAKDLQRYNNNLLDMLVDGGVISESLSNKLKGRYKYYMPIYSSELSTFADLDSGKYLKSLSLDNAIKDVTKTGKQILSLEKSMENKTYNVLSAIAKNKLAQEINASGKYNGDSDLLYYNNGQLTKTKVSPEILSDISNNKASHYADVIHEIPVLKQFIDASNMAYKFILDPFFQIKNVIVDFTDSAGIYSKDKPHFVPNYFKAIHAVANNSEAFHEVLANGLGNIGEGWTAPKVSYDADGNIITKQNKFQRLYANLEAMPKIAEYFSLKDKYMKQVKKDYEAGKYNNSSKYAYTDDNGQVITFYRYHKDAKNISDNYDYNKSIVSHKTGFGIAFMDNDTYTKGKADKDIIKTTLSSKNGFLTNTDTKLENEQVNKLNSIFNEYIPDVVMFGNNITESNTINIINQASEMIANATDNNTGKKAWDEFYNSLNKDGYILTNKDGSRTAVVKSTNQIDVLNNNTPSLKSLIENAKVKAMIDASDVNLNFNRGGKVTKALSKSGFKFLNAGIQGFDKFVTHVSEGVKTPKGMGSLLLEFTSIGIGTAIANAILNGDDEEYDKLPYYYKNNYYMFRVGDNQYIRIPKGRVQTLYNVIFEYATGLRKEDNPKDYFDSLVSAFDSAVLPPALESASPISAYVQLFENKDAFGNEIYSEKYDTTEEKIQKSVYHLLSNYFGRYGRIVKDITDGDSTTDLFNEFDFYKDTTKANRHYSTALDLVEYYQNSDNVKTLDDKAMKKYIDTQNYALRSINSEINQGKKAGRSTKDMKMLYAARDDLLLSMINNYKNFDKEVDENGNTWYYFDEHCFMYNAKTQKFVKKY